MQHAELQGCQGFRRGGLFQCGCSLLCKEESWREAAAQEEVRLAWRTHQRVAVVQQLQRHSRDRAAD